MRVSVLLACSVWTFACAGAQRDTWELPNFSDRIGVSITNPGDSDVDRVVVLKMADVRKLASTFPGTLTIAAEAKRPTQFLPSQIDDLDRDGNPDEVAIEVKLKAREEKTIYLYYSFTLHDELPTPKRVHASHRYGYNQATAAIESEEIGYRTYGGFFFDVQAHAPGQLGLFNSWIGYTRTSDPPSEGEDVIHLGDTLGLGGIFLRAEDQTFRPPLNTPDYLHRAVKTDEPAYRIISTGPIRAIVEANLPRWTVGADEVALRALYEMRAGEHTIRCHWQITPVHVSRTFEVGAGVRDLPGLQRVDEKNVVITSGVQDTKTGRVALGLSFSPDNAHHGGTLKTPDGDNQVIIFSKTLTATHDAAGDYEFAAGWSRSGESDVVKGLQKVLLEEQVEPRVRLLRHETNPVPKRLEGEPI